MPFSAADDTLYGDTTGVLAGRMTGGAQLLTPEAATAAGGNNGSNLVGDASALRGFARGGDDTISIPIALNQRAIGDAWTITDHAKGGADTISVYGDMFSFTVVAGDAETMSGHGRGGDDVILVTGPSNVVGDGLLMEGHARGGDDQMTGWGPGRGGGPNLYGDADTLTGHAKGGDDTLTGKDDFQALLYGDAQVLSGHAHGGDDLLVGGMYAYSLNQYEPFNRLYGDGVQLLDHAHAGNDTLVSGAHSDDQMWGDAAVIGPDAVRGDNLFVFAPPNGHDQIMDFQPGKDHIKLEGFGLGSFQDLVSHFQATADGTLISFDASDDLLLRGVSVGQLSAGDFLFG